MPRPISVGTRDEGGRPLSGARRRLAAHATLPLFRNAYALALNQGVNAGLGIVFWILAARLYPVTVVGRNAALISAMAFVAIIAQLGLRNAMTWALPRAGRNAARFVWRAYGAAGSLAALLAPAFLLLLGTGDATADIFRDDIGFVASFAVATVAATLFALQDGVLVGLGRSPWVPVENAVFGVLKVALLVLLVGVMPELGIFAAWTLVMPPLILLVSGLIFGRLLRHRTSPAGHEGSTGGGAMARFVMGDFVGTLLIQGTIRLFPIVVVAVLGAAAGAYSYQAWTLALPLFLLAGSMTASLTVEASGDPARRPEYGALMLRNLLRLLIPAGVALFVAGPWVLELFGHDYAREGGTLVRVLAVSVIPLMLNVWYYAMCRSRGSVMGIVTNQAIVASIALVTAFALLPAIGVTATGVGWLVGQSAAVLVILATDRGRHGEEAVGKAVGAALRSVAGRR